VEIHKDSFVLRYDFLSTVLNMNTSVNDGTATWRRIVKNQI